MARFKDFGDKGVYRPEDLEPINFRLLEQDFSCKTILPGAVLVDIISAADGEGGADAVTEIFHKALATPEDVTRFYALIRDENVVVSLETLVEILTWLVEQYGQRPTLRPSSSAPGPQTTGPTSEDGTSSTPDAQPASL